VFLCVGFFIFHPMSLTEGTSSMCEGFSMSELKAANFLLQHGGATVQTMRKPLLVLDGMMHLVWSGFQVYVPKPIDPDELDAVVAASSGRMS
jgi:hypothetical protein